METRIRSMPAMAMPAMATPATAFALLPVAVPHEGHGNPDWYRSVLHYLIEPVHLPLTLAVVVLLFLASRRATGTLRRRAARVRHR